MNKNLDRIFFRYTIKTRDGLTYYEISLREYMRRNKEDILIGISFAEYEWINMESPDVVIKQ